MSGLFWTLLKLYPSFFVFIQWPIWCPCFCSRTWGLPGNSWWFLCMFQNSAIISTGRFSSRIIDNLEINNNKKRAWWECQKVVINVIINMQIVFYKALVNKSVPYRSDLFCFLAYSPQGRIIKSCHKQIKRLTFNPGEPLAVTQWLPEAHFLILETELMARASGACWWG